MRCGSLKIDLGCGDEKKQGFIGIDLKNADINRDLRKGLPFCNDSVVEVYAHDILEHFTNDEFIELMREINRVLQKGGVVDIGVPRRDCNDPTHKMMFDEKTFDYFTADNKHNQIYGLPTFKILDKKVKDKVILIKLTK